MSELKNLPINKHSKLLLERAKASPSPSRPDCLRILDWAMEEKILDEDQQEAVTFLLNQDPEKAIKALGLQNWKNQDLEHLQTAEQLAQELADLAVSVVMYGEAPAS